ncbi:MAG TPA: PilZ domain-containing protein [Bryobacteraceae bacterium]|nr:PilZ domain-containing protein [Bryobacteraceae bacterium]
MERRRSSRLDISLQCRVSSPRIGSRVLMGITENMSRGDVLVLLDGEQALPELPCVGDPLIVEIELPENHAFGRKCMQCQTTVVRVSQSEEGVPRVALRIHKMRFQSCGKDSVQLIGQRTGVRQLLM